MITSENSNTNHCFCGHLIFVWLCNSLSPKSGATDPRRWFYEAWRKVFQVQVKVASGSVARPRHALLVWWWSCHAGFEVDIHSASQYSIFPSHFHWTNYILALFLVSWGASSKQFIPKILRWISSHTPHSRNPAHYTFDVIITNNRLKSLIIQRQWQPWEN